MSQEWCAVESCPRYRRERLAPSNNEKGNRLCAGCLEQLKDNLAKLPGLYCDCEEMLVNGGARGIERVRGGTPKGVSLNDAIVAARSEMLAVASSWAGLVVDERRLPARPHRTVSELSRFLLTHLLWLARHSAANDAVREIVRVVKTAEEALEPYSSRRVELGSCQESECNAKIYATIGATSRPTRVSCDRGHLWRPNQWLVLGRRLEESGQLRGGRTIQDGDFLA